MIDVLRYVRVDVVQQRLAEDLQVSRLHCVMGHVEDEQVDGGLRRPQLARAERHTQINIDT